MRFLKKLLLCTIFGSHKMFIDGSVFKEIRCARCGRVLLRAWPQTPDLR